MVKVPRTLAAAAVLLVTACSGDDSSAADSGSEDVQQQAAAGSVPSANITEGCVDDGNPDVDYFPDKVAADHAHGWDVSYHGNYKVVETEVTAGAGHAVAQHRVLSSTYVLVQCGTEAPPLEGDLADATVVEVPVSSFVDGGSVFYAAIEQLDVADALAGDAEPLIGDTEASYFPEVWARMQAGQVREIGYDANLEVLAEIAPDFYTNYAGDDTMFQQIRNLDIPVVMYFPYSEPPLGAAEHLKFLSLFFNLEAEANDVFGPIEQRYTALKADIATHAGQLTEQPTVMVGVLGDDAVTTRERERFEPELIREAGAEAVPDLPGGGIGTIAIESALDLAESADFWLDLTFFPPGESVADYLAADPRLANIPAFESGNAFTRIGSRGYDYFLHGALEVDVMLADLASIIYPDAFGDHEPVFVGRIPAE